MFDSLSKAYNFAVELLQLKEQVKNNSKNIEALKSQVNRLTQANNKLVTYAKQLEKQQEQDRENFRLTIENLLLKHEKEILQIRDSWSKQDHNHNRINDSFG